MVPNPLVLSSSTSPRGRHPTGSVRSVAVRTRIIAVLCAAVIGAPCLPVVTPAVLAQSAIPAGTVSGTAVAATSAYVPLPEPRRLTDTRDGTGPVRAGQSLVVQVTGSAPLPDPTVTRAVVLNVTVVGPAAVGFWTVYPTGGPIPVASNLNVDERASMLGASLTLANLVTVPVGVDGTVSIFAQTGGHVVVDMLGAYVERSTSTAGRFQPLPAPDRIYDSRSGWVLAPGATTTVTVPDARGASAAVLNVTAIASGAGFWTVYPTSVPERPTASNLNSLGLFHVTANQVIVALDDEGRFNVYSQPGGHLVVDVVGLMTGDQAPESDVGLFVPLDRPTRFLDTRDPRLAASGGARMQLPAWSPEVDVAGHPALAPTDVAALAMNVTITESLSAGYVSVGPAGAHPPHERWRETSTLNSTRAGQTIPNHATVAVSTRGFEVFTQSGGHLLADVAGYYTGRPTGAAFGGPDNVDPTPFACLGFPTRPVSEVVNGSSRATVQRAQQRLLDLGFWLVAVDGQYGLTTKQAVMAFQKWTGLPATTVIDEATAVALNRTICRPSPSRSGADMFVVDKRRQLGFVVRGSSAQWIINVSTGSEVPYRELSEKTGQWETGDSVTPNGDWRVYLERPEGWWDGDLGSIYRPKYFRGGVAVHGSNSIPNHPASHGCVRVSVPAMDMIWATDAIPFRSRVIVHD
ncbi:MAG: hypothetical protein RI958_1816 [Actinomycetota bacterium]